MVNCIDFEEYNTLLQSKILQMFDHEGQFFLDNSPQCHCKLAREVIEYSWVCANNYYQGLTKSKKKGKDNFINSVVESLSREVLTTACCRKFAPCAIWYTWGYKAVQSELNGNADFVIDPEILPKFDQIIGTFKCHQFVFAFDHGFIYEIIEKGGID